MDILKWLMLMNQSIKNKKYCKNGSSAQPTSQQAGPAECFFEVGAQAVKKSCSVVSGA